MVHIVSDTDDTYDAELTPDVTRRYSNRDEVKERLLALALDGVSNEGLTLSIAHPSLSQLIKDAEVSSSTVSRIWPTTEEFDFELMKRLIDSDSNEGAAFDQATIDLAESIIFSNLPLLLTAQGRVLLLQETVRRAVKQNFDAVLDNFSWKIYTALTVTVPSLVDESQRTEIHAELQRVEARFVATMSTFYDRMLTVFQRETLPGITTKQIAAAGSAVVEGLAQRHFVHREDVDVELWAPGLNGEPVLWHLSALTYLGVVQLYTRPLSKGPDFKIETNLVPLTSDHR
jgi:hypothetical protein